MTWTRLSDDYADSPEMLSVSRSARLLDVEALVWCNKHTTDGYLPRAALRRITDAEDPEADVAELVGAGRWTDAETGWQLDWSDQETAEHVTERRDEWRRRDERRRRHNKGDHSTCDPKRCHYLIANPEELTRETRSETRSETRPPAPVPSRPVPTPREGEGEGAEADRAGARRPSPEDGDANTRAARHAFKLHNDDGPNDSLTCAVCALPPGNARHLVDGHAWLRLDDEGIVCAVCRRPHEDAA